MIRALSSLLSHPVVTVGMAVFSIVAVVASVLLVPRYLARLPRDFLIHDSSARHPSALLRVLRNLLGLLLVLLGVVMLVLPGQGLITLLVGVLLLDVPGKHALAQRVLGRPRVLSVVNKLRARHHAEPLAAP
jgi:hypothetical protein